MSKLFNILVAGLMLFGLCDVSGATALKPQAGVIYPGGAQIELAGSRAWFTVPMGFTGQYNQQEKLFEMVSQAGEQINVGYEGKTYADAIDYAREPITTTDGVVMNPIKSEEVKLGKASGEVFAYSGKALAILNVGAVAVVFKTPEGKGLSISSAGLGNNYQEFSRQIGLVTPSLRFAAYEKERKAEEAELAKQAEIEAEKAARLEAESRASEQTSSSSSSSSGSSSGSSYRPRFIPSMPVHMPVYE